LIIPPAPDPSTTLVLRRAFTASRQRVFRAWITPAALESWFRPRGMSVIVRSLDARVGGSFHFDLENGSSIVGTYLHFVPPEKLVFTWSGEAIQGGETIITLDFLDQGAVTEVVLTHEGLSTPERRALLEGGWPSLLDALARALKEHPRLNAWVEGEGIRLLRAIHIGVAVALEEGLIVPVVHDADRKSLREIAQETQRLAQHAREGKLTREEVTESTFTVSNLGIYGVDAFTPIVNPPEVAILGIGRIIEKPARGLQGVEWRKMLTLSLTFDHRAVDGAPAAAFLQAVYKQLETPAALAE
jgi:uncharacterized protein YndB with AHSA1/START domain